MPARDVRRARLLDEPRAREHQNIGTDHVLDGIKDRRMTGELVRPATQEIGARAVLALLERQRPAQRRADARLERLEIGAIASRRVWGKSGERQQEAVAAISRDLRLGQHLWHS